MAAAIYLLLVDNIAAATVDWFATLPPEKQADILWKEDQEGQLSWDGGQGTPWNSGDASYSIVTTPVHSGTKALRSTIDTSRGESGVRWPQRGIPGTPGTLPDQAYYSAWIYFPEVFDSEWYMLMQWKRESSTTWSDPVKSVNVDKVGDHLRLHLHDFVDAAGNYDETGRPVAVSPIDFPVGRWVHLEAFYDWATDPTGSVVVWQDGVEVLRQTNTITEYDYDCCGHPHQWSVNAYGGKLNPNPHTMYLDDAAISRSRIGPTPGSSALPGDFNHDGRVDAADYTVWRGSLGSTKDLRANGDDSGPSQGVIDQADYQLWKANFGQSAGVGAIGAAVPEPTALLLGLIAALSFVSSSRCRRLLPLAV